MVFDKMAAAAAATQYNGCRALGEGGVQIKAVKNAKQ